MRIIKKNTSVQNLTQQELQDAYDFMHNECKGTWVEPVFLNAWNDYLNGVFKYDGATFVREVTDYFFECAAFIHDWLNSLGYVGKGVDIYFFDIMIALKYPTNIMFERNKWMQWTFFNTFWHKIKGTYISSDVPEYLKDY